MRTVSRPPLAAGSGFPRPCQASSRRARYDRYVKSGLGVCSRTGHIVLAASTKFRCSISALPMSAQLSSVSLWDGAQHTRLRCPAVFVPPPGIFPKEFRSFRGEQGGGEGGIRTHGTREGSTVFETARFNRSRTSPFSSSYHLPGHDSVSVRFGYRRLATGRRSVKSKERLQRARSSVG